MKNKKSKTQAFTGGQLPVNFFFDEADLLQLLSLYYAEGGRGWMSQLQRQDMRPELPRCASGQLDRSRIHGGNALLRRFTHPQVDWAIGQLRRHETVRAGKRIAGWFEYCLKVMLGREDPAAEANATMPEVRKQDKIRALAAMGQLLGQVAEQIDKPKQAIQKEDRLDELMRKLSELNGLADEEG